MPARERRDEPLQRIDLDRLREMVVEARGPGALLVLAAP
jgi:hypothetical protein